MDSRPGTAFARSDAALGRLIGESRLAVLKAARRPCTTSGLAAACFMSTASASRHAAVLRDAGLIVSTRRGKAIVHAVTPLGLVLLSGLERR